VIDVDRHFVSVATCLPFCWQKHFHKENIDFFWIKQGYEIQKVQDLMIFDNYMFKSTEKSIL